MACISKHFREDFWDSLGTAFPTEPAIDTLADWAVESLCCNNPNYQLGEH